MNELIRNIPLNTIVKLPSGTDLTNSTPIIDSSETIRDFTMSRDFTTGVIEQLSTTNDLSSSFDSSFESAASSLNSLLSLDPMIGFELFAIVFTILYFVQLTLNQSKQRHSLATGILEYVNVGNLISWPKQSLNKQRVYR